MWWFEPVYADALDPDFVETCFVSRCAGEPATCTGYMDRVGAAPPEHPDPAIVHRDECVKLENDGWKSVCRTGQSPWHWTEVLCKPNAAGVLEAPPPTRKNGFGSMSMVSVGIAALLLVLAKRKRKQ